MSGFVLHPQAYTDLEEIWEYIAADSLDAADQVPRRFTKRSSHWFRFPT
jgi:plasmid stabilization system protein ParE